MLWNTEAGGGRRFASPLQEHYGKLVRYVIFVTTMLLVGFWDNPRWFHFRSFDNFQVLLK